MVAVGHQQEASTTTCLWRLMVALGDLQGVGLGTSTCFALLVVLAWPRQAATGGRVMLCMRGLLQCWGVARLMT